MVSNSVVVCTSRHQYWRPSDGPEGASYCLSWRLAVEANNVRAWRTVPTQCLRHVESYMTGGQYDREINFIIDHVISYLDGVDLSNDGLDAWILDVDDTCISNLIYYKGKRFGSAAYKGQSAVVYKSEIREQLEEEGYRIWDNVGDQWSDLQGNCTGNRTFKLPNPLYFVP
ncbi:Acid phosphatase 1 [Camellia lanceoleosa]|uniref:Acid phosphatase 1 n=1 Tax=Camellia lanceoleosa TaxID=1840588 RepID=A0ACC0GAA8_9ERIC|nr:Acid phosphatase 1 [Camellia lanceoleosa]